MKNSLNSPILSIAILALVLLAPAPVLAETYTYDSSGRLTSVTYVDESTIHYDYDNAGNVTQRFVDDGSLATATGATESALKAIKKLQKKKAVKKHKKSKKFAKKARKHLELALALFKDLDIDNGNSEIGNAIADLGKIKKEKKSVKKQIKKLKAILLPG